MKLFGLNLSLNPFGPRAGARAAAEAPTRRGLDPMEDLWQGGDPLPPGLTNAYEQVVWVYRAINVIAEQVANVPFVFSRGERGREHLITGGPLHEFYRRPHPHLNRFQYWELRVIWLLLRGECVRVPIWDGRRLARVLILDPAQFQHVVQDQQLIGWRYTGSGPGTPLESQVFLPGEIWFEKLPNPFDFWRGLSPLRVATIAARTDYAAGAYMQGIMENNGDAGVVVRSEHYLSEDQQSEIVAALRNRKRRAGLADKPLFVNGATEIVRPTLTSSDLQFLENRKFNRGEICAAFGVPEEILISTDNAKYDVMEGARLNFIENRVAPLCSRLEAEEEATVRAIDPRAVGWFELESLPILQKSRRERLQAARLGFEMGVPFNELNRVLDLGFKALPWGDRGYLGSGLSEIDTPQTSVERSAVDGRDAFHSVPNKSVHRTDVAQNVPNQNSNKRAND